MFRIDILQWIRDKLGKRLVKYPSPVTGDLVVIEKGTFKKQGYARTPIGTAHPTQSGLRLIDEILTQGDDSQVVVTYVFANENSQPLQNVFNYSKEFSENASSYPIYIRTFKDVLRSSYERTGPSTIGAALTSLIGVDITAAGSAYTSTVGILFSGGAGSGAAASAYQASGALTNIVLTAAGTSYTSAPTVVIDPGFTITGAGTTAVNQSYQTTGVYFNGKPVYVGLTTATIFVAYDGTEWRIVLAPYDNVTVAYYISPSTAVNSPWLTTFTFNDGIAPNPTVTISAGTGATATALLQPVSAKLVKETSAPSEGANGGLFVDVTRIYKTLPGPGLTGSIVSGSTFGILGATYSIEDVLGTNPADTGIDTLDSSETPVDSNTETFKSVTVPFSSTTVNYKDVGRRGFVFDGQRTWVAPSSVPPTQSELIDVQRELETKDRARQDKMTYAAGGSPLVSKEFSRYGGLDVSTDTFSAPSTVPANSGATVERLIHEKEKEARLISLVIATGNIITERRQYNEKFLECYVDIEYSLVLATDAQTANSATIIYERHTFDENSKLRVKIKKTYNVPANTYIETVSKGLHVPTLFTSMYSDNIQGTTRFSREGRSENVSYKVTHSFGTTRQTPSEQYFVENDFLVFGFSIRGIMNATTGTRTVDGVAYTQTLAASSPTLTAYNALVGTYVGFGGASEIEVAGIYHTITYEAKPL